MLEDERGTDKAKQIMKGKRWPSAPHVLGARLRRLVPQLKAAGVLVNYTRTGPQGRTWTFEPEVPF